MMSIDLNRIWDNGDDASRGTGVEPAEPRQPLAFTRLRHLPETASVAGQEAARKNFLRISIAST
jgi:hypothetical protein